MFFSELRLQGFKSFVEPTTLKIDAGMTGIVGPNGCGKSNLIEALRWAMGETSAKKMRGSEMDDVIFGGTEQRPSRNIAEVSLVLDNRTRDATAEYNNADDLMISRKITRGEGSDYRINGKAVRQKDVQLVFADQATGAHSTSIVSQGQVGAIVNAKPQERRQILEEAAGITGLHARRHEAELRLRAAETNLGRVEDVLKGLESQYNSLQRQAKQATKYRDIAESIRRTEAALLHVRWTEGQTNLADSDMALTNTDRAVRDLTAVVTRGSTERAEMAAALPPLRQDEAAAAAALQRLMIARETIDTELARAATQLEEQRRLLEQTVADSAREAELTTDAEAAISRLEDEKRHLTQTRETAQSTLPQLEAEQAAAQTTVSEIEGRVTTLTTKLANAQAEYQSLTAQVQQFSARLTNIAERRTAVEAQLATLAATDEEDAARRAASDKVLAAEATVTARSAAAEAAETAATQADADAISARSAKIAEQTALSKAEAEAAALVEILTGGEALFTPIIDQISTETGCEAALAAALGDALSAGLASDAPLYWQDHGTISTPALPAGAEPLAPHVKAPQALARIIGFIGLVPDAATGTRLAATLQPGQILVSRAGDCWRWDGYTAKADAPTAAAIKLKQKNRLQEVKADIVTRQQSYNGAAALLQTAEGNVERLTAAARAARADLQTAYQQLDAARAENAALVQKEAATLSQREAHKATLATLGEEYSKGESDKNSASSALAALPAFTMVEDELQAERQALYAAREELTSAQQRLLAQKAEVGDVDRRMLAVTGDIQSWNDRMTAASQRQTDLAERRAAAENAITRLQSRPAEIEEQRKTILSQLSDAETKRAQASDTLVAAENKLNMRERQLKQEEEQLMEAREGRVRAEGTLTAAQHLLTELQARMVEKLDAEPEQLLAISGFEAMAAIPPADELDKRLTKLVGERENMGPVNLRAEVEAEELTGELGRMQSERADLAEAIGKLRTAIAELNNEARTRLTEAFDQVNSHFQDLFVRLFGGGRAYLQLTEDAETNNDPLSAGLEIYASPPGKKLQVLSLLSGGEKALTATALLFAVFMCNPSPICVLDEVDAPLDESNVGRFCDLVEEIARAKKTRFLIVTHHRLTMARMDRLYGVTMQERGISSLMSVDLATAERFRESPGADAKTGTKAA